MINKFIKKTSGMTLTELLLVIMVLSVIATVTITSLNNNVSKSESIAKINVAQSILSQAIVLYQAENFCSGDLSFCDIFLSEAPDVEKVYQSIFSSKLKTEQNCGILPNLGCFAQNYYSYPDGTKYDSIDASTDYYKVRLQNGISIAIKIPHGNCKDNICANIIIDTNGLLPPNKLNRDVFEGKITQNQVIFDFEK